MVPMARKGPVRLPLRRRPVPSPTRSTMRLAFESTRCPLLRKRCLQPCAHGRPKVASVRDFQFLEPSSVTEASHMLVDHEEGRLFAGGTALLLAMRQRMLTPSHIVYLGGVRGLSRIEYDERNGLRIGALVRHAEIADSAVVNTAYPMLADMAGRVANPQVRNGGTLAGNLCYGDPATDPPPCLMALNAQVVAVGTDGERTIEIDRFFIDYFQSA